MIDMIVSFRALRSSAALGILTGSLCGLAGCTGEEKPAATAENTRATPAVKTKGGKIVLDETGGPGGKGSLMPEFPKKPK